LEHFYYLKKVIKETKKPSMKNQNNLRYSQNLKKVEKIKTSKNLNVVI